MFSARAAAEMLPSYLIGRDGRFVGRVLGAREWSSTQGRLLMQELLQQMN